MKDIARANLQRRLSYVNDHLAGKDYLLGTFSVRRLFVCGGELVARHSAGHHPVAQPGRVHGPNGRPPSGASGIEGRGPGQITVWAPASPLVLSPKDLA